ncbi:hypothetical protein K3169_04810 [Pseudomonas phytophila]|uniref:Methyl-accepting chemotaxis protein n=1 Tax=Pseudomonas phytophila TaxID=2867264 RepID=A0ABY6FH25_9PSED|nr:hypothetical protein [Pseudomonas phytophila]UXZ97230.1 hypothetical protein K3169_04810 [Pseudomonas phytophila]
MKLPLRPSLSRNVVLRALGLIMLIGVCAYQQLQINQIRAGFDSSPSLDTVNAITQRINGVDDRLDAVSQLKPVTINDFRASQQALSNRIDAVHALIKQVQQASQNADQDAASVQEVIVLGARLEELQVKLQELRTAKPPSAQPVAQPKAKSAAQPRKVAAQAKAPEPAAPFSIVGIEYRGGERFLSVAPPGSTRLSQLNLVRPGDMVAGSNWQLSSLDESRALFSINGAPRILPLRP